VQISYINLKRRPDRDEQFLKMNSGVAQFTRMDAVDGKLLQVADLISAGVVREPAPAYAPGALGAAVSHRILWEQCVARSTALTIAEDDAVFNQSFASKATAVLERLPADWDIILWGWNFDSILHVEVIEGVKQTVMSFDPRPLGTQVTQFQKADCGIAPFRLLGAFGTVCYSISPKGAGQLLGLCFPLKTENISIPGLRRVVPNIYLDFVLNKYYPTVKAYASFPPLVWTENDKATSDISLVSGPQNSEDVPVSRPVNATLWSPVFRPTAPVPAAEQQRGRPQ